MDKINNKPHLGEFIAALRLPFISVSVLAFTFGSLINRVHFNIPVFSIGLACVILTHLAANLANDYADSASGADWYDLKPYKFFGGSKFIQLGVFKEKFYLRASFFLFFSGLVCVLALSLVIRDASVVLFFAAIMFLGWSYSCKPLQLSYCRMGEPVIFLIFGPVTVMGGYFLQAGIFPDLKSFILSLPFGFLTAAILFANEIPDYLDDKKSGKITWVSLFGREKSYIIYLVLTGCAFAAVAGSILLGYLKVTAAVCFIFILPAIKNMLILKKAPDEKDKFIISSRLAIFIHTLTSIALILSIIT